MAKVICAYYADKETFVWADDGGIYGRNLFVQIIANLVACMNVTVEGFIIGEHSEQLLESFDVALTKHSWKEITPRQQS